VVSLGLGLLFATAACGEKDAGEDPAAWRAYDARMATWIECLHGNGLPEVRYRGHSTSVRNPKMELESIPDGAYETHAAWERCRPQQPGDADRPVPFQHYETPPEALREELAVAKCLREHGFPDYPDPDPDPAPDRSPGKYDNVKAGDMPELDKAWKACRKQLGLSDMSGG
jgi:hypothetical protein